MCEIGYATARRFVNESSKVVILDCNQEALDNTQSELSPLTGGVCADVSSPDEIEAAFKEVDEIMGRHADPEKIVALFAFLASCEAKYMTGTAITVDGGESLGMYIAMEE
jgi:NAD(P)-dependent dehydrogenase (short-subunit alcohol dehydrogenase family)